MPMVFLTWSAVAIAVYGAVGAYLHRAFTREPVSVLVAVDASNPMRKDWSSVKSRLQHLAATARYTQFSLATDKGCVHGWSERLDLGATTPYGPRHIARLARTDHCPGSGDANRRIVLTNAEEGDDFFGQAGYVLIRP